jgi:hypothetical protein
VSGTYNLEKVNPDLAPISTAVSILGAPGLAAYFALEKIGKPKKRETVLVSGSAGAVGSEAVQGAKFHECNVIGIAGLDAKIEFLEKDLGSIRGFITKKSAI